MEKWKKSKCQTLRRSASHKTVCTAFVVLELVILEGLVMNAVMRKLWDLKSAIVVGIIIYAVFLLAMYALKKRKGISWQYLAELAFCVYGTSLLKLTGIFSMQYSLAGFKSYNLVPFIGSAFIPALLNFLLFLPYGFFLPLVFPSRKWTWKKLLCIAAGTSLCIEVLQLFGGRYAEIDDVLLNTLGALSGYFIYICMVLFRKNRKKAVLYFVSLATTLAVCFYGIYLVRDHEEQRLDGLSSVESSISKIRIYATGDSQVIPLESDIYNRFITQLSNCAGHLLEVNSISGGGMINDNDCFIEVKFNEPQTISFSNAAGFVISNTDRLLYNASRNILYWGRSGYQFCVDYAKLDTDLKEHEADIFAQYQVLQEMIAQSFE